jgi:predicted MFS family arabinose efflux permease
MLAMLVVFTFAFNWQVLIPLYATRDLGGDAGLFGALMAVFGVGSLAGALIMAGRSSRPNPRRLALLSLALAVCTVGMVAVATPAVAFVGAAVVGAAGIAFAITANSTLQLTADERMRGRVMSLYSVIFLGSTPIGGAIAGVVGEAWGARAGLVLGAAAAAGAGLWLLARVRAGGVTVAAGRGSAAQPDPASSPGS